MNTRATILLLSLGAVGYGCDQSPAEPAPVSKSPGAPQTASKPPPDPRADGAAYKTRRALNVKAWARARALPDCGGRDLPDQDLALCARVVETRAALRKAEEANATDDVVLAAAFDHAAASEAVRERFQKYAMVWVMGKDPRTLETVEVVDPNEEARRTAKNAPEPGDDGDEGDKHAGHDHAPGAHALKSKGTPYTSLLNGYTVATSEGLRRLTVALRFAPPDVRDAALARYDAFLDRYPESRVALSQLQEAELLEPDRAFRATVADVRSKERAKPAAVQSETAAEKTATKPAPGPAPEK